MLLPDDRSVIAREEHLPGLALVLDPAAVAALVSSAIGVEVRPLGATHVRYKPGTNCVVGHRLSCAGVEVLCTAKAFRPDDHAKLDKAVLKSVPEHGSAWGVIVAADDAVVVSTLVNDRDLPALPLLADPVERAALLDRILGPARSPSAAAPGCVRTIRHKPERRWVGVVAVDGRPTYRIKAYRPVDVKRALAGHTALGTGTTAPLGWSRRRAVIAGRWIDGTPLAELLHRGDDSCIDAVGAQLAALHLRPPDDRVQVLGNSELRRAVRTAAEAVAALDEGIGCDARRLARRTARALPERSGTTLIHGDLSADQVIRSDRGIDLIDFDDARNGDPLVDLASFAADLVYAELDGRLGMDAGRVVDDLIVAYARAGGPARFDDLAPHLAGALLRRAVLPFRERRPGWTATCEGVVEAAAAALDGRVVPT